MVAAGLENGHVEGTSAAEGRQPSWLQNKCAIYCVAAQRQPSRALACTHFMRLKLPNAGLACDLKCIAEALPLPHEKSLPFSAPSGTVTIVPDDSGNEGRKVCARRIDHRS